MVALLVDLLRLVLVINFSFGEKLFRFQPSNSEKMIIYSLYVGHFQVDERLPTHTLMVAFIVENMLMERDMVKVSWPGLTELVTRYKIHQPKPALKLNVAELV